LVLCEGYAGGFIEGRKTSIIARGGPPYRQYNREREREREGEGGLIYMMRTGIGQHRGVGKEGGGSGLCTHAVPSTPSLVCGRRVPAPSYSRYAWWRIATNKREAQREVLRRDAQIHLEHRGGCCGSLAHASRIPAQQVWIGVSCQQISIRRRLAACFAS